MSERVWGYVTAVTKIQFSNESDLALNQFVLCPIIAKMLTNKLNNSLAIYMTTVVVLTCLEQN